MTALISPLPRQGTFAICFNTSMPDVTSKGAVEVRAVFSLTRQIKAREALSPPALRAQVAQYRGARGNSSESSPKDPAEAVSRSEEHPRYSPAAAEAAGDPGDRQGGREQSIQRPPGHLHLWQRAGGRCYPLRLCRVVCWGMDFFSFLFVYLFIFQEVFIF